MKLGKTGFAIFFILAMSIPLVKADRSASPLSLTLTAYQDDFVKIEEEFEADPMELRVEVDLHGDEVTGIHVQDDEGNPLDIRVVDQTALIDSIGATAFQVTYFSKGLVMTSSNVASISVSSHTPTSIVLPIGADFFDMSDIPTRIDVFGGQTHLEFASGEIYVYYLIGLPKLNKESLASIESAESYIVAKSSEGYAVEGAQGILDEAMALYESGKYLDSKNCADDALTLAVKTIVCADSARDCIGEAEAALDSVRSTSNNVAEIESVTENIANAKEFFDAGAYREASVSASYAILQIQSISELRLFIVNRQFIGNIVVFSLITGLIFISINKKLRLSLFYNNIMGVET